MENLSLEKIALELERTQAYIKIQNLIGRYEALHSASRQAETCELFAKKTPGGKLVFNGHIYKGYEGVELHYKGFMADAEQDLTGKIYAHEVMTPVIEVAGDAQSAKATFATFGFETGTKADGSRLSTWTYGRYAVDFIKEDGEWVIYNMDFHTYFNTPFDGPGWGEKPDVPMPEFFAGEPELLAYVPVHHGDVKEPYKPMARDTADFDIHNMRPAPPLPYEAWDYISDPWVVEEKE